VSPGEHGVCGRAVMADQKGVFMGSDEIKLAGLQNVRVFSRSIIPHIMEIADPGPELYQKLDIKQLTRLMAIGLKYQNKLIAVEMDQLKLQQEAIAEMEKTIEGFAR
jgi:hypothetical protein